MTKFNPLVGLFAASLAMGAVSSAHAQSENAGGQLDLFKPGKGDFVGTPFSNTLISPLPYIAPEGGITVAPGGVGPATQVTMEAHLTAESGAIVQEVLWRIYDSHADAGGNLTLMARGAGAVATFALPRGEYLVHAAFGRAGATRRLSVGIEPFTETLILDAGGLRLHSVVGDDRKLKGDKVRFEISQETPEGEKVIVARNVGPGQVVGLNTGVYHVVSRYGEVNAIVRADIEITPGKLTDVTMRHTGAEVTLKLVAQEGGEALANTRWTVLTNAGDTVHESVGAFPRIILAEGAYTAVAQHKQKMYIRDFKTAAGIDTDVEVRLADIIKGESDIESR